MDAVFKTDVGCVCGGAQCFYGVSRVMPGGVLRNGVSLLLATV